MFVHVKQTSLLRNRKVTEYRCILSQSDGISVYRFPKWRNIGVSFPKRLLHKKEKRIKALSNANFRVSKDTVVCAVHWPSGFEKIKVNEKSRPKDPPSIWPGVQSSTDIMSTTTTRKRSLFKCTQHWGRSTIRFSQ